MSTERDMFGDFTGPRWPTEVEDAADEADRHLFLALAIANRHGWSEAAEIIRDAQKLVRACMHPAKRAETEGR